MTRNIGSFRLKINETKTNVMDPNGIGPVRVDETKIELVPKFRYTDSMISMKDTTSEEIRIRLLISGKTVTQIQASRRHSCTPLSGALVSMTASHGQSRKRMRKYTRIHIWLWNRMLRIRWTERNTNTWVRDKVVVKEEEGLLCFINHWTYIVDSKWLERLKGDVNGLTEDMAAQKKVQTRIEDRTRNVIPSISWFHGYCRPSHISQTVTGIPAVGSLSEQLTERPGASHKRLPLLGFRIVQLVAETII